MISPKKTMAILKNNNDEKITMIPLSTRILFELIRKARTINDLCELLLEPSNVVGARWSQLNKAKMISKLGKEWKLVNL